MKIENHHISEFVIPLKLITLDLQFLQFRPSVVSGSFATPAVGALQSVPTPGNYSGSSRPGAGTGQ